MLAGLVGALLLCVVALILLLPHNASTGGQQGGQQGGPSSNFTNITSPLTTIGATTSTSQTANTTTTVTSSQSNQTNQTFNYTQYIQQLTNPGNSGTTTILYAYCVGSPSVPFNQSYYAQLDQSGVAEWKPTTGFPAPFLDGSCASTGGTVYCLGGSSILYRGTSRQAYYANVSPNGIGSWRQTSSYPVPFSSGSCTAYSGYIYCVGTSNATASRDVFYAPLSQSGIGTWTAGTSYPAPFYGGQCSAYHGYIYCLGDSYLNASAVGHSSTSNSALIGQILANGGLPSINTSDYYASISSAGVGHWKKITSTPQPLIGGSCTISNGTVYCVGGSEASFEAASVLENFSAYTDLNSSTDAISYLQSLFANDTSAAFYATIGANGAVGSWSYTLPYLARLQNGRCASNGSNIYCIGGSAGNGQQVFYSALVPGFGIDDWLSTTDYPIPFYSGYCSTNANA